MGEPGKCTIPVLLHQEARLPLQLGGTFMWKHMATKHYKLAALETTYVSLSILEPVGFTHSHTVQHNLNWTSVIVGPSQSHLALIDGHYLVHLGKRSASSGL